MTTPKYWVRISIDFDPALNAIGSCYELHQDDERVSLVVREADGPFDSPGDVLRFCLDAVASRYGVPLALF